MNKRFEHGGNIYKLARENGREDYIDFSANINPLGISEMGKEAYHKAIDNLLDYPDPDYIALLEDISSFHDVELKDIFVGNGAIEMIYKSFEFIAPSRALIVAPTFVEYERALNRVGCKPDFLILTDEQDFILDVELLISKSSEYDLIVMCSPNNPTGKAVPKSEIIKLLSHIDNDLSSSCKIFLDEAFLDFIGEDESMTELYKEYTNLFILRSATKFFAIPGLRLGYVITSDEDFATYYKETKIPWSINRVAEEVFRASMNDKEYIEKTVRTNLISREKMFSGLSQIEGIKAYSSEGNYIFFRLDKDLDLRSIMLDKGIVIRSCDNYIGLDKRFYRVAVKKHEENMLLVNLLREVLNRD